ncbi:IS200/IS605 family element transposase accessory protein TnpB, partial [Candidatus Micrarchaeota archaeon]|nr:IS200/IS605 family element transposase accessory protein TnpB [Candidatus Micrarchaeota archaeon]
KLEFSKTQLHQARTDVKDARDALQRRGQQVERSIARDTRWVEEIDEALKNPDKREYKEGSRNLFKIKKANGGLTTKPHTPGYYSRQAAKQRQLIEKKKKTLETIERGRIRFKPTRISLHKGSFKLSVKEDNPRILVSGFEGIAPFELKIITRPQQPLVGKNKGQSSTRSAKYLQRAIRNFLAYSADALLFGMNDRESMLMKAKRPEKVEKRDAAIKKKQAGFAKKAKAIEKWLGRKLAQEETEIMQSAHAEFFTTFKPVRNKKYLAFLELVAAKLEENPAFFSPEKYPVLIRTPLQKNKHRNIHNLKPRDWVYFIQIGYQPVLDFVPTRLTSTVMGIDRGLSHLLAISVYDPASRKFTHNQLVANPIKGWKVRRRKLRKSIQKLERRIRAQKNIHLHENQMLKKLRGIESAVSNYLHEVSAGIIKTAEKHNSAIVLENLEALKQHARRKSKRMEKLNYWLSLFDYGEVAQLVAYKAKRAGIPVYDVEPAGTSQNCSRCMEAGTDSTAYVRDPTNKKRGYCQICRKQTPKSEIDADLNAARVIALCYYQKRNNPQPFGERKRFYYAKTK